MPETNPFSILLAPSDDEAVANAKAQMAMLRGTRDIGQALSLAPSPVVQGLGKPYMERAEKGTEELGRLAGDRTNYLVNATNAATHAYQAKTGRMAVEQGRYTISTPDDLGGRWRTDAKTGQSEYILPPHLQKAFGRAMLSPPGMPSGPVPTGPGPMGPEVPPASPGEAPVAPGGAPAAPQAPLKGAALTPLGAVEGVGPGVLGDLPTDVHSLMEAQMRKKLPPEIRTKIEKAESALQKMRAAMDAVQAKPGAFGIGEDLSAFVPGTFLKNAVQSLQTNMRDPEATAYRTRVLSQAATAVHDLAGARGFQPSEVGQFSRYIPTGNDNAKTVIAKLTPAQQDAKQEYARLLATHLPMLYSASDGADVPSIDVSPEAQATVGQPPGLPSDKIRVKEKATGRVGKIPRAEFDPNKYEAIK